MKFLPYIPSLVFLLLPYYYIAVVWPDSAWDALLPYPIYLNMDTAILAMLFAFAVSFFQTNYIKRILVALLCFGVGYLADNLFTHIMVAVYGCRYSVV